MGTILWRDITRPAFQVARTTPRAQGKGEQAQIAQGMGAIREGSRITGQVILTIPFFGQGGRKTGLPKGLGLLLGQPHDVGAQHEVVKGPAQPVEHGATMVLVQARVEVLLVEAAPTPARGAALARQSAYSRRHDGMSIKPCLP